MNKDTRGQTKGIKTKDMETHDTHKRLTDTKTVRATSLKVLNCCFNLFHLLKLKVTHILLVCSNQLMVFTAL